MSEVARRRVLEGILRTLTSSTGRTYDTRTFDSRLRIQKSIYLLGALDYGPAKRYSFSYYLRGPYSPDLARDYYSIQFPISGRGMFIPPSLLKPVTVAVERGNRFLEAVCTIHLVAKYNPGVPASEVQDLVTHVKPETSSELREAWRYLREEHLLQ